MVVHGPNDVAVVTAGHDVHGESKHLALCLLLLSLLGFVTEVKQVEQQDLTKHTNDKDIYLVEAALCGRRLRVPAFVVIFE